MENKQIDLTGLEALIERNLIPIEEDRIDLSKDLTGYITWRAF
jgi:hypothetical protein